MFNNQNSPLASVGNIYTLGVRITLSAFKGSSILFYDLTQ